MVFRASSYHVTRQAPRALSSENNKKKKSRVRAVKVTSQSIRAGRN